MKSEEVIDAAKAIKSVSSGLDSRKRNGFFLEIKKKNDGLHPEPGNFQPDRGYKNPL